MASNCFILAHDNIFNKVVLGEHALYYRSDEEVCDILNEMNVHILEKGKMLEANLEKIKSMDFENAKNELLKIKGVGEKVAQCSLLYGFGRIEGFPQDVWVKRIVSELYPDGLPECIKGTEGIAQQYLFHWRRNLENL